MEKEFVPYELALRMKGLGFNEPCFAHFVKHYDEIKCILNSDDFDEWWTNNSDNLDVKAPLYQQAFRWFREKYNLYTELHKKFDGIGVSIILSEYRHDMRQDKEVEYHIPKYFGTIYRLYEEAELACLEKLIEIVEEKNKV